MTSDKINNYLGTMRKLKSDMLNVSANLKRFGYEAHAKEMRGAAKILQTWINGIQKDLES